MLVQVYSQCKCDALGQHSRIFLNRWSVNALVVFDPLLLVPTNDVSMIHQTNRCGLLSLGALSNDPLEIVIVDLVLTIQ